MDQVHWVVHRLEVSVMYINMVEEGLGKLNTPLSKYDMW